MTATELKTIINAYGGVDYLLGFGFDNSAAITFTPSQFSYSSNLDETNDLLKFTAYDSNGRPYLVLKPVELVQTILIKDATITDISIYDRVSLRS